jgi:glycosyltransferase involved in cell wall biosynthesis
LKTPKVSVVIPNYNYARYVGEAIESVLAQTYRDFEIIVINNGSTDNSIEVLKKYEDRIRCFTQENQGQSGARNRGIQESRGEWIAFLDADDVWLPTKLEQQVPLFSDPKVGIVYCGVQVTDAELKTVRTIIPDSRGDLLKKFALGASAVIVGGESTAVIRKKCFDELGLFDRELSICGGWDMYRRICCRYTVEVVREALMKYRVHGSNAHGRVDIFEHDVLLRLDKMFKDPNAQTIQHLKRQSYGQSYLLLSGSCLHAKRPFLAIKYAFWAVLHWPPTLSYMAALPLRRLRNQRALKSLSGL